ncbi:MAG: hypothetical protein ACLGIN_18380, partial [Candidatus Sericytochromatia bacterium]
MARPTSIKLGPFTGGENRVTDPTLLGPSTATQAQNVDPADGVLRGLYGPGTSIATKAANTVSIHFTPDGSWLSSTNKQLYVTGPGINGTWTLSPDDFTIYYTDGAGGRPYAIANSSTYRLGVKKPVAGTAPDGFSLTNGAAGGARGYSVTFYNPYTGWESNPLSLGSASAYDGAVIKFQTNGVDTGAEYVRIYGTKVDDASGPKYALKDSVGNRVEVKVTDASWTDDTVYSPNTALPLDWGEYTISDSGANADNAEAPALDVLAD